MSAVALRKESVDRNLLASPFIIIFGVSLSARRAWIEIQPMRGKTDEEIVALRKESVDRNMGGETLYMDTRSRSPQGERG